MDRASFELIGNVGKLEIKPIKGDKKLAIISLATSERWKAEGGDWNEKTYWHRVVVFAPAKVALIEKAVQMGTRLRLVGREGELAGEPDRLARQVDAVILCTPTQMHAAQTIACLKAGKHVQCEIPLADTLAAPADTA